MKKNSLFIILVFAAASCNIIGKDHKPDDQAAKIIKFDTLEKSSILNTLFKPEIKEWCLWKPTKGDTIFPVSDDGYCHTKVVSIKKFAEVPKEKAVIILGTYQFTKEPKQQSTIEMQNDSPMGSLAIVEKSEDGKWALTKFEKYVEGNMNTEPELHKIGSQWFLKNSGYYHLWMGEQHSEYIYIHIPSCVKAITLTNDDNSGMYEETDPEYTETSQTIEDISTKDQTKINVITTEIKYEEGRGRFKTTDKKTYLLNDSCIFRPVK